MKLIEHYKYAEEKLFNNLNEDEKKYILDFVEFGFEYLDSYDDAVIEFEEYQLDLRKESVLNWLNKNYYEILKTCNELVREEYLDCRYFSMEELFETCMKLHRAWILNGKMRDIIYYYKVDFLIKCGYEEMPEEIFYAFISQTDEEHLSKSSLKMLLDKIIK